MKIGLYMATQWPVCVDLRQEMSNLCEQTRVAKENGFSSVMVGQHFLSEPLQMIQAEPLIARLSAEGEGMTFGIAVVLLAMQNPVTVAEYSASLDWITNGKYILGVGIGYRREEFEALGVPFGERAGRFEEAIPLIRRLWTEESVEHRGKYFSVGGLRASIKPKQDGGLPIWVGGDVFASVRRAARLACPWVIPPTMNYEEIKARLDVYKYTQKELGANHPHGQPIIREVAIGDSREQAMAAAGPYLLAKYEAYANWGQTATRTESSLADNFDEFVENRFIIGDESQVADEIFRYREDFGVRDFLVRVKWPGFGQREVLKALDRIGRICNR